MTRSRRLIKYSTEHLHIVQEIAADQRAHERVDFGRGQPGNQYQQAHTLNVKTVTVNPASEEDNGLDVTDYLDHILLTPEQANYPETPLETPVHGRCTPQPKPKEGRR